MVENGPPNVKQDTAKATPRREGLSIQVTPMAGFAFGALVVSMLAFALAIGRRWPLAETMPASATTVETSQPTKDGKLATLEQAMSQPAIAFESLDWDPGVGRQPSN